MRIAQAELRVAVSAAANAYLCNVHVQASMTVCAGVLAHWLLHSRHVNHVVDMSAGTPSE